MLDQPLLARQPIYNVSMEIVGYELLFRSDEHKTAIFDDGDHASSEVIINAFSNVGIEELVGPYQAYINFTRHLIINPIPFTKEQIVIEVLEDVIIDHELVECLRKLKVQGYVIALDDYIYQGNFEDIADLIDIVKLDVLALSEEELEVQIYLLKPYNIKLLAEKVETHEMFEKCKDLGFDFFQGFFMCKPQIIRGKKVEANRAVILKLLSDLQDPNVKIADLEKLLASDSAFSYKIIKILSSATYDFAGKIDSLSRAIVILGLQQIKSWASLFALSKLSDKPVAIRATAMMRANMCEYLAQYIIGDDPKSYFTVGLFSSLDALLGMELKEALSTLQITEEVKAALLEHEGSMGLVLHSVHCHERASWQQIHWQELEKFNIGVDEINNAYRHAIKSSDELGELLQN